MNARQFFDLVSKLRHAQREYERTQLTRHLVEKKNIEALIDAEIWRVEEIIEQQKQQQPQQQSLL